MYTVNKAIWVKREADKVESVILMDGYYLQTFTRATLVELMTSKDVVYTGEQMDDIIVELLERKILKEG